LTEKKRRYDLDCLRVIAILHVLSLAKEYITPYFSVSTRWNIWYFVCSLVSWTLVTTLLGYGQIWFNKKSRLLKKNNEAIYSFYILHQTIIIILEYYIIQFDLSILSKIILLVLTSFPLIIIIYKVLIYPFKIPRILFGMKKNSLDSRLFLVELFLNTQK